MYNHRILNVLPGFMKLTFKIQFTQAGLRQLFQEKQHITIPELPGKRKNYFDDIILLFSGGGGDDKRILGGS